MRPVSRGQSPKQGDFSPYTTAKTDLVSRLGSYCSYCERYIPTLLAVEHIQPKGGPHGQPKLEGKWENFLLACSNCNGTKRDKKMDLAEVLLPDRDNTFVAFTYSPDGHIRPRDDLSSPAKAMAKKILSTTGLDKPLEPTMDENERLIALDRVAQRMEAWSMALEIRKDIDKDPKNKALYRIALRVAQALGFFSIWMNVFVDNEHMRNLLIDGFAGTRNSGCFDRNGHTVQPAPNPDGLASGSKL